LVGVKLNNCTTLYPHGDEVQTVEPWTPPDLWEHISTAVANKILDQIEAGPGEGRRYSIKPQSGKDRGAWAVVMRVCGDKLSKEQCNKVIKTWAENGLIEERDYDDPVERKPARCAYVISRPGAEWRH
jgi:hypothetical protein